MRYLFLLLISVKILLAVTLRPEQFYVVYTYNFLKNIHWSETNKTENYSLLVLTDNDLLKENFELLEKKREIDNKKIVVDFYAKKELFLYNAIFIDKAMLSRYQDIYKSVEEKQTLIISVEYPDANMIMINLIHSQTIQLDFEINRANILNQNLGISDEMILLGGTEIDVAKLYKKTRLSLKEEEKHSQELSLKIESSKKEATLLEKHILKQNSIINQKTVEIEIQVDELNQQKKKIEEQKIDIEAKQIAVAKQTEIIENLKNSIVSAKEKLQNISSQVALSNTEIKKQQERLSFLHTITTTKDKEIEQQNKILSEVEKHIEINKNDLVVKEEVISSQKNIIFVLIFFIVVIAVLIFFLVKLVRENRRQAERDFLTGLYNRRYFTKMAKKILSQGISQENPLTMAMMDIDYFKLVNDTYGHDIGDDVLRVVSTILIEKLNKDSVIARWGGEEFIVISRLSKDEITELFEMIKEDIASHTFVTKDSKSFNITISIGVHHIQDKHSLEVMIEEADKLLYTAKDQGRNRIIYNA